jgi:hypothetical protein
MDATGFVLSITFTLVKPAAAAGVARPARFDPERATAKVRRGGMLSSTSFRFQHTPAILVEITHLTAAPLRAEVIDRIFCSQIWLKPSSYGVMPCHTRPCGRHVGKIPLPALPQPSIPPPFPHATTRGNHGSPTEELTYTIEIVQCGWR